MPESPDSSLELYNVPGYEEMHSSVLTMSIK